MAFKITFLCLILTFIVIVCHAGSIHKREVKDGENLSTDTSQVLDKLFEDLNKGIKQLAKDGINLEGILQNVTDKANEFGTQIQKLGQEIGQKVQETVKQQGLAE